MMLGNLPIELREFAHNIKDHDYDSCGQYKIDENEARKLIKALEEVQTDLTSIISQE